MNSLPGWWREIRHGRGDRRLLFYLSPAAVLHELEQAVNPFIVHRGLRVRELLNLVRTGEPSASKFRAALEKLLGSTEIGAHKLGLSNETH